MDLSGTSVFYQSVLRAWSLALRNTRSEVQLCSLVEEEPLFYNPLIPVTELTFKSICLRFQRAGITKLGDLRFDEDWKSGEVLRAATGIMSVRLLQRIVEGVASSLPTFLKEALQHHSAGDQETFPSLPIAAEMGDHQEEGALLSFRTPQLAGFAEVSKKALYSICMKVLHRNSLDGLKESREKLCLLNFLIGQGKLAVWLTRKNKLQGSGTLDPELLLRAAVRIRLRIEYAYFKTTHNLPAFHRVWGQGGVLCGTDEEGGLLLFF
ncbi:hypothetical protein MHYP_G00241350 [Metynnis hypsauchen]